MRGDMRIGESTSWLKTERCGHRGRYDEHASAPTLARGISSGYCGSGCVYECMHVRADAMSSVVRRKMHVHC
jgi:hypothetical protein